MAGNSKIIERSEIRAFPTIKKASEHEFDAEVPEGMSMTALMGMKTTEAANGIYVSAIAALGSKAERYGSMASANFAELEPRDAIEAMLIAQMTATYVAMTVLSERHFGAGSFQVRESYERSVTRLSRTYLAQMDALKKYRAKAQQVVRVERVTVEEGGQAIVGNVDGVGGR